MQSHLQAALLGHGINTNISLTTTEEEDKDEQDEEGEDVEEFVDEGQKFVGDLLEDGKIRSQETDIVFASPSAWAIACKRFINPDKKSGCGWASVKYKGKKLDAYKNIWYKKRKEGEQKHDKGDITNAMLIATEKRSYVEEFENEMFELSKVMAASISQSRVVVKHNTIANRTFTHDANTLVECVPFSNLGKIQPFLISLSTNAALLLDFHCHLTKSEVCGYLAGHWDVNSHNLQITHAFPCRNVKSERESAPQVEAKIAKMIEKEHLTLVGWYHSHPHCAATPTLRDIDAQLDYQIRMKGTSDNSYTPCIGIIVSPYSYENTSLESNIIAYWVIPPPEAKPNEYGRPMLMSYSVVQDSILATNVMDEMKKCAQYYQKEKDFVHFMDKFNATTTYIEKLKTTLTSKFPRDQNETTLWSFIRDILGCSFLDKEIPISIPSVSKTSHMLASLGTTVNLNPSLMMNTDIASMLFNSGKFTNSSLLGIPDPMAQSTLAANSMFLSPNLFKMQDLLRPLSTSSPISTKSKSDIKSSQLKIPSSTEIKTSKYDVPTDLNILNLKNKYDFVGSDMNISRSSSRNDYNVSDLSISSVKMPKMEFSVADLSVSSVRAPKSDYSNLDLSRSLREPSPKMGKAEYPTLDLSLSSSKSIIDNFEHIPSDLSVTKSDEFSSLSSLIENTTGSGVDKDRIMPE
ncbi:MPN domain-containing protein CG4751-like isoform X2 [Photinus pyralis]|uniref:MPN domain-containing protein CG4751-like isoform X2 n=1 Tax=Photinus pyralis TaxID=7054 RepID=UPI0012671C48|nr:MPN domain-containing protein CG4751-like isoform X2 [Photinus pyralis]